MHVSIPMHAYVPVYIYSILILDLWGGGVIWFTVLGVHALGQSVQAGGDVCMMIFTSTVIYTNGTLLIHMTKNNEHRDFCTLIQKVTPNTVSPLVSERTFHGHCYWRKNHVRSDAYLQLSHYATQHLLKTCGISTNLKVSFYHLN
jgi:hypothetical protein